jgi:hypothetical protein
MSSQPNTIIRTYRGNQARTTAWFQSDAADLAKQGYYPTTQNWTPGAYGCGSFIAAVLLCFILIGFIVFIYMLIVKPDGTLTVTYEYRNAQPVADGKVCPRCAETVKAAAAVCRFCGQQFDTASAPVPSVPSLRKAPSTCRVDPFALAREGRDALHRSLAALDKNALLIIVRDCNLDPTGFAQNWQRDDLARHIEAEATKEVARERGLGVRF